MECWSGGIVEYLIWSIGIMEYWNDGFMDRAIILMEVEGMSACAGLEAECQEYFALCLTFIPQDKLSDPQACPVEWQQAYSTG